jgi:hypothetical protein
MIPPLLTGSTEPLSSWEPYPNECVLTRYIIDVLFSEKFLTNDFINRCWLLQSICHLREELWGFFSYQSPQILYISPAYSLC